MIKVIGVRFRQAGKIYFFSPGKFDINKGDNVTFQNLKPRFHPLTRQHVTGVFRNLHFGRSFGK